jgi:hypothetical protein
MKIIPLRINSNSPELNDYASETLDDVVPDAVVRKFRTDSGFVLATIWRDSVHEVIYQTPLRFFWSRLKRDRELLKYYGDGQSWSEDWPIDFGKSRKREDGKVRALYSKIMDYMTFVTTEFDSHRSDKRWEGKLD